MRPRVAYFPIERWDDYAMRSAAARYAAAAPFPHVRIESFLDMAVARQVMEEFPSHSDLRWTQYKHVSSRKLGSTALASFPPIARSVVEELLAPRFVDWLSRLTGIPGLLADPTLEGGGLHQTESGGYLNVHADFTHHYRKPTWRRRVNVLVYFNEDWHDEWGGNLELWDRKVSRCERSIAPSLNHAVIFSTSEDSYHGHPGPLSCPRGVTRKSLALYYYTAESEAAQGRVKPTDWQFRPQDSALRKLLIRADRRLLNAYSMLRWRFGLSDKWISRILSRK